MKHRLLIATIIAVLAASAALHAQDQCACAVKPVAETLTLDQVLGNMEAARKKLTTFRAEVVKERLTVPLEETEVFKGTIQFKMPRLLDMELKSQRTGKTILYIVGPEYAWIYRRDDQQAEGVPLKDVGKKMQGANPLEYGLAGDMNEFRKSFDLKLLRREKINSADATLLQMRPFGAAPEDMDGTILIWLDRATWLPVQVREYKNQGDIVETHTFSKMKRNIKIKDKVFIFKPGKDVDVVIHPAD